MVAGFVAGTVAGFAVGTLGEYLMHRFMHDGRVLQRVHGRHHLLGVGQGWLGELLDYSRGGVPAAVALAAPFCWPLRLPSVGLGLAVGAGLHMAAAAYSHQVQHERPELVFWMRKPVHHLHHRHRMWKTNFGISTDFWDRVFGTYEDTPWNPTRRGLEHAMLDFLRIDWGSPPKLDRAARARWEREVVRRNRSSRDPQTSPPSPKASKTNHPATATRSAPGPS